MQQRYGFVYHTENPNKPGIDEGYVGVVNESKGILRRFRDHIGRRNRLKPLLKSANVKFENHVHQIFHGLIEECYALEIELRPLPLIGWNLAPGGRGGGVTDRLELMSSIRSHNQSLRMQDSDIKKRQSESFKSNYYSDVELQKLRQLRAREHMADPDKKEACLSAMHKKKKCPHCDYESNAGNITQHIKRKHSE